MKHFILTVIFTVFVSSILANTKEGSNSATKESSSSKLTSTATKLSNEESTQLVTYFFKIIDQYPLSNMIVVKGKSYDEESGKYYLLYDIRDGKGNIVLSVSESAVFDEYGALTLAAASGE